MSNKEICSLLAENHALIEKNNNLLGKSDALRLHNDALHQNLHQSATTIASLRTEKARLQHERHNLERKKLELEVRHASVTDENDELQKRVDGLEQENDGLQQHAADLHARIDDLEAALARSRRKNAGMKETTQRHHELIEVIEGSLRGAELERDALLIAAREGEEEAVQQRERIAALERELREECGENELEECDAGNDGVEMMDGWAQEEDWWAKAAETSRAELEERKGSRFDWDVVEPVKEEGWVNDWDVVREEKEEGGPSAW